MANIWGSKLSREIRERAYSAASIERKAREISAIEAALDQAKRELSAMQFRLADIDQKIASLSAIDPAEIRRINSTPRSGLFRYGELSSAIIAVVRDAAEPLPTFIIVMTVARMLDLPTEGADWAITRARVRKRLQVYAKQGVIARLHASDSREVGYWEWVGMD